MAKIGTVDVHKAVVKFELDRAKPNVPPEQLCDALDIVLPIISDIVDVALRKAPWFVRLIASGVVRSILAAVDQWRVTVCPPDNTTPLPQPTEPEPEA